MKYCILATLLAIVAIGGSAGAIGDIHGAQPFAQTGDIPIVDYQGPPAPLGYGTIPFGQGRDDATVHKAFGQDPFEATGVAHKTFGRLPAVFPFAQTAKCQHTAAPTRIVRADQTALTVWGRSPMTAKRDAPMDVVGDTPGIKAISPTRLVGAEGSTVKTSDTDGIGAMACGGITGRSPAQVETGGRTQALTGGAGALPRDGFAPAHTF